MTNEEKQQRVTAQIDTELESVTQRIANYTRSHAWVVANREKLIAIGANVSIMGSMIDFDNPTRDQVLAIIREFGGTWNKDTSSDGMQYIRAATSESPRLRCWNAALPPCCKLIKITETIPDDQVVRTRTITRIECDPNATGV